METWTFVEENAVMAEMGRSIRAKAVGGVLRDKFYVLLDACGGDAEAFGSALRNCIAIGFQSSTGQQGHYLPLRYAFVMAKMYDRTHNPLPGLAGRWFLVINGEVHRPVVEPCAVCAKFEDSRIGTCRPMTPTCSQNVFRPGEPITGWFDAHEPDRANLMETFRPSFRPANRLFARGEPGKLLTAHSLSTDKEECDEARKVRSARARVGAVTATFKRKECARCVFYRAADSEHAAVLLCRGRSWSGGACGGPFVAADLRATARHVLRPWMLHAYACAGELPDSEPWRKLCRDDVRHRTWDVYVVGPVYGEPPQVAIGAKYLTGSWTKQYLMPYKEFCKSLGVAPNSKRFKADALSTVEQMLIVATMTHPCLKTRISSYSGRRWARHFGTVRDANKPVKLLFATPTGRVRTEEIADVTDLFRLGFLEPCDIFMTARRRAVSARIAKKYQALYAAAENEPHEINQEDA